MTARTSHPSEQTTQTGELPQAQAGPDVIDLGLGQPSPRLLPLGMVADAAAAQLGPAADPLVLQYGSIPGALGVRSALARLMTERYRHPVDPSELLMTGGISSALSFVSQVFAPPGQPVVCSDPTYFLARGIFESQGLPVVGVPVDDEGLCVDQLEQRLDTGLRPAFVYCMPSFHNPTGVQLAPARARALVELAQQHDFVVVADEPYVMLSFDDPPPPCMMAYDEGRGRVLSLGSFSKILGPGLRLGWLHAHPRLVERFSYHGALRSGGGLNPVMGSIAQRVIESGDLDRHIDGLRSTFAERCAALVEALRASIPQARFTAPRGGYFVWIDLPPGLEAGPLREAALEHGVAFCPGPRCAVERDLSGSIRLCFAFYEADELQRGVERLAPLVNQTKSAGR